MTAQGGGIGRFARKKVDSPNDKPAPAPPVATTGSEQPPIASNVVLPSFAVNDMQRADTFGNVDMFGGSFDMNFESASNDLSYDHDPSTFNGFVVVDEPNDTPLASESDFTPASSGPNVSMVAETDPSQTSTTTQQGSNVTQAVQEKTNAGPFSSLRGNGPHTPSSSAENMDAPVASTPLARSNTSVSQLSASENAPTVGISMFSRKRAAPSQEVTTVDASSGNNPATLEVVIPPPRLQPRKPLPTQDGSIIASSIANGTSNNEIFLPGLSGGMDKVATPSPRTGNSESVVGQKVLQRNVDAMLITPDSANAVVDFPMRKDLFTSTENQSSISPTSVYQDNADTMAPETEETEDDFDGLLSHFLSDLRNEMDLLAKGDAEILDLEVDLSQAFALTLSNRSQVLDLLDAVEETNLEADALIREMMQF